MDNYLMAIIPAVLSSVISGIITALIQPIVDNWLKAAIESKNKRTAVKISIIAITFAIVFAIVFASCVFIAMRYNLGNGTGTTSETTIVTDTSSSSQDLSGNNSQGNSDQEETTSYASKTISLLKLEPYTGQRFHVGYDDSDCEDVFGNKYSTTLYSYKEQENGECSVTYRINSQYDKFTFTSGVSGRGSEGTAHIFIYGDGKLLYDRKLTCTSESEFVELDVHGVKDLTIEMYGHTEPVVSIIGFTLLCAHIWDPMLQ